MSYFQDVIGVEGSKRKLGFFLDNFKRSRIIPHLALVAEKGAGKTMLANLIAKNLPASNSDGHKPIISINCVSVSTDSFFQQIVLPHMVDRECTVFFDEASEIPHKFGMALLTILEQNSLNRTNYTYDGRIFEFDFTKHSFLFATTEAHKINRALKNRLEIVELEPYTQNNLAQMIQRKMPETEFETGVLDSIAGVLRNNPRIATRMVTNLKGYLGERKTFKARDWEFVKRQLNILPLGLSNIELQILQIVNGRSLTSLTNLSARTGLSPEALRQDGEIYLLKNDLMSIEGRGRKITMKGAEYLKNLA